MRRAEQPYAVVEAFEREQGQCNGTKKLLATYGDRLVCVRYRYDPARGVRHKTVELIVETMPWTPRARAPRREPNDLVGVRIEYSETALRARIKGAGGIWRPR